MYPITIAPYCVSRTGAPIGLNYEATPKIRMLSVDEHEMPIWNCIFNGRNSKRREGELHLSNVVRMDRLMSAPESYITMFDIAKAVKANDKIRYQRYLTNQELDQRLAQQPFQQSQPKQRIMKMVSNIKNKFKKKTMNLTTTKLRNKQQQQFVSAWRKVQTRTI